VFPQARQVQHVGTQGLWRRVVRRGAHDVTAAGMLQLGQFAHQRAHAFALGFIGDAR